MAIANGYKNINTGTEYIIILVKPTFANKNEIKLTTVAIAR